MLPPNQRFQIENVSVMEAIDFPFPPKEDRTDTIGDVAPQDLRAIQACSVRPQFVSGGLDLRRRPMAQGRGTERRACVQNDVASWPTYGFDSRNRRLATPMMAPGVTYG